MEKGKKFIALFLISSLLMLSTNLYAKERRGAELIIQRIGDQARKVKRTQLDGTPWETTDITGIWGELIAVKPNSLLLLDASGKDVSADIADIKAIRIMKKSKFWTGAGIGVLIGGAAGAILGYSSGDDDPGMMFTFTAGQKALMGGIGFGLVGLLLGGIAGAGAGTDNTFQIDRMSDSEIQETMEELRKKARIRDYK
jgi:hypothetical protein